MKKLISLLVTLGLSLMITVAVSASEAPTVTFETVALTDETVGDYGDPIPEKDAYILNVNVSNITLNRDSSNSPTGTMIGAFQLDFATNSELIDWENSWVCESSAGAELIPGTGTIQILNTADPSRNDSFPAKGESISDSDTTTYATALIYIPQGQSLNLEVLNLAFTVSDYASGKVVTGSGVTYDIKAGNLNCPITKIALGEVKEEVKPVAAEWVAPQVGTEYQNCGFLATIAYDAAKAGVRFNVASTVLDKTGTKDVPFASLTNVENAENITVGLNITNVDLAETSETLTATAELY